MSERVSFPHREIRAAHTPTTLTVYQAYSPDIASPAVAEQRFVPPFSRTRMTWIKPSFLWMAYRCGWATKPGQERVLAIEVAREGFAWALAHSCLSHHDPQVHLNHAAWAEQRDRTSVRIQWDPERGLRHEPLDHRAIQVGIGGDAVPRYVDEWTTAITDVTDRFRDVGALVAAGDLTAAARLVPVEPTYPITSDLMDVIGGTRTTRE